MELETTGVEAPEVAAPETTVETGVNNPEVAAPEVTEETTKQEPSAPDRDFERDAAFARMRREAEEARKKADESQEAVKALTTMFKNAEDPIAEAYAFATGRPAAEIQKERQIQSQTEALRLENERLKQELTAKEVAVAMERDLREVRKIDPKIKSLDELGETFVSLIASGKVSAADAYYATQARRGKETKTPPPTMGKVKTSPAEKDFYTADEVKAMSPEEVSKNLDVIHRSMKNWK